MNCLRCNGLVVSDDSIAVEIGSSSNFHGWRCLNCGMVIDDVIRHNRRRLSSEPRMLRHQNLRRHLGHV